MQSPDGDNCAGLTTEHQVKAFLIQLITFASTWLVPRFPQNSPAQIEVTLPIKIGNWRSEIEFALEGIGAVGLQLSRRRAATIAHVPISSQNFFMSILPPETIATIGPLPALPVSAAATGSAPAPSEMIRAFSAMSRIARFVSSRLTTI